MYLWNNSNNIIDLGKDRPASFVPVEISANEAQWIENNLITTLKMTDPSIKKRRDTQALRYMFWDAIAATILSNAISE